MCWTPNFRNFFDILIHTIFSYLFAIAAIKKIMHLLRHLGPLILDFARQFDSIIEKLMDSDFDLHIHPDLPLDLSAIPSTLPSLTVAHMAQLARFQLQGLSVDGLS